ncbi:hypothetical protein PV721_05325 [Streptomyces sp. MB09-01]|nr:MULTISPECIES: hypothetical protein [unclassified Streptomyces]MDX3533795.1 hypothetical protein [Streptomyces sp. MB09-01]
MISKNVTVDESAEPTEQALSRSVDDRLIDEPVGHAQARGPAARPGL